MKSEERRAYVRGILAACVDYRVTEETMAQILVDLGVKPEELMELSDAKSNRSNPSQVH